MTTLRHRLTTLAVAFALSLGGLAVVAQPAQAGCEFPRYLSIDDAREYEGNGTNLFVFVVRTSVCSHPATVSYTTLDGSGWFPAVAPTDFTATSGTLSWTAGDNSTRTIAVSVVGDVADEFNETFSVHLFDPTGFTVVDDAVGAGSILDDDGPISWNVDDSACVEGDPVGFILYVSCPFIVTVPSAQGGDVSVHVKTTTGGSATADIDYVAIADQVLTVTAGSTSTQGVVRIRRDQACEGDETVKVALFAPDTGVLGDNVATMTIVEDDIFC